MWITNQKAFKKSAVVFWPGSEVKIEGQYPTHYLPYNRSLSFEKRIDYLCTMLEQDDPPTFWQAGTKVGPDQLGPPGSDQPQVAQARNMSIGEHRHCCVTFKII